MTEKAKPTTLSEDQLEYAQQKLMEARALEREPRALRLHLSPEEQERRRPPKPWMLLGAEQDRPPDAPAEQARVATARRAHAYRAKRIAALYRDV